MNVVYNIATQNRYAAWYRMRVVLYTLIKYELNMI